MSTFNLVFDGKTYTLPKTSLSNMLNHHPDLLDDNTYAVQSAVPSEIFETFVDSLMTEETISFTNENVVSLSLLAKEFYLSDLNFQCSVFATLFGLSKRVSRLEYQIASSRQYANEIESHERRLETHRLEIENLKTKTVTELVSDLTNLRSELDPLKNGLQDLTRDFTTWVPKSLNFSTTKPDLSDGIISYLSRKHWGHVHLTGIVTISSQWLSEISLNLVSGWTSCWPFWSANEPDQWICCDFGEMRIRPTQYTILGGRLKSWVIEGSVDGESWTEIDRQTNHDFKLFLDDSGVPYKGVPELFELSNPIASRFIRLSQPDNDDFGEIGYCIGVQAIEFFGTLSE
jgi:hypothetical protein